MTQTMLLLLGPQVQTVSLCAPEVSTSQQLTTLLPGWNVTPDGLPDQLAGIAFYEGPPEQRASARARQ